MGVNRLGAVLDPARPTFGYLTGTGYYNYAKYFESVYGVFSAGTDSVSYFDSAGNDTFMGMTNIARLTGTGYFHQVQDPDTAIANGTAGGINTMSLTLPLSYGLTQNGTWA